MDPDRPERIFPGDSASHPPSPTQPSGTTSPTNNGNSNSNSIAARIANSFTTLFTAALAAANLPPTSTVRVVPVSLPEHVFHPRPRRPRPAPVTQRWMDWRDEDVPAEFRASSAPGELAWCGGGATAATTSTTGEVKKEVGEGGLAATVYDPVAAAAAASSNFHRNVAAGLALEELEAQAYAWLAARLRSETYPGDEPMLVPVPAVPQTPIEPSRGGWPGPKMPGPSSGSGSGSGSGPGSGPEPKVPEGKMPRAPRWAAQKGAGPVPVAMRLSTPRSPDFSPASPSLLGRVAPPTTRRPASRSVSPYRPRSPNLVFSPAPPSPLRRASSPFALRPASPPESPGRLRSLVLVFPLAPLPLLGPRLFPPARDLSPLALPPPSRPESPYRLRSPVLDFPPAPVSPLAREPSPFALPLPSRPAPPYQRRSPVLAFTPAPPSSNGWMPGSPSPMRDAIRSGAVFGPPARREEWLPPARFPVRSPVGSPSGQGWLSLSPPARLVPFGSPGPRESPPSQMVSPYRPRSPAQPWRAWVASSMPSSQSHSSGQMTVSPEPSPKPLLAGDMSPRTYRRSIPARFRSPSPPTPPTPSPVRRAGSWLSRLPPLSPVPWSASPAWLPPPDPSPSPLFSPASPLVTPRTPVPPAAANGGQQSPSSPRKDDWRRRRTSRQGGLGRSRSRASRADQMACRW